LGKRRGIDELPKVTEAALRGLEKEVAALQLHLPA
jgi:hypothetical protein